MIRSIIILKTNSHKQIKFISINTKTESNPKTMTEAFNIFFVTIDRNIDSKIIHTNSNYKDYLQDPVLNSFFINPATAKEVISAFNEMETKKTTGFNSIPTQILKISNQIIYKPLTYLSNLSFSNGIFPDLLKTYNNYGLITLISNLSKLMEKIVHPKLYTFLEKNYLFSERQYGFRNSLSTNHALY